MGGEKVCVRTLEKQDIPQLAGLYELFWGEKSDVLKMEQQFDVLEKDKSYILLVAENIDRAILGSVMGIVCKELYGDCRPFLLVENMVVDKQCRKSGIGRLLLSELEARAKERDCTQMLLVTEIDRTDACSFYEGFGFQKNNKGYKKKI